MSEELLFCIESQVRVRYSCLQIASPHSHAPVVEGDVAILKAVRLSHFDAVKQVRDMIDVAGVGAHFAESTARVT